MEREIWFYDSSVAGDWGDDEQIEVTVTETHVLITIIAEHAVDSYNSTFRSSIKLPFDKVCELAGLLQGALGREEKA